MSSRRQRLKGPRGPQGPVVLGLECGGQHVGASLLRLTESPGAASAGWRWLESGGSHRGHRHADTLLTLVAAMLERQDLTAADLNLIGVGRGPGGFTGVRVGLATGLGLGLGLGAPVWPVDSLAALAMNGSGAGGVVVPMFDARKGEVYGAAYRVAPGALPERITPQRVAIATDVLEEARVACPDGTLHVIGDGAVAHGCATDVPPRWHVPCASHVAWLAARHWEAAGRDADQAPAIDPVYLRKSEAELAEARAASGR